MLVATTTDMDNINDTIEKYGDIINLPHHVSKEHHPMSMNARAAQFAPFAALNGHSAAIAETARITDQPLVLSEQDKAILNDTLHRLLAVIASKPRVVVTYFIPDAHKEGGRYVTHDGMLSKWDEHQQVIILEDHTRIALRNIASLIIPKNE